MTGFVHQAADADAFLTGAHGKAEIPWLATVEVTATVFADADKTPGAIRADIFKAEDRLNSKGQRIPGNGLAAHGAVIRIGRKVLLDVHRYGNWLAGRPPIKP